MILTMLKPTQNTDHRTNAELATNNLFVAITARTFASRFLSRGTFALSARALSTLACVTFTWRTVAGHFDRFIDCLCVCDCKS